MTPPRVAPGEPIRAETFNALADFARVLVTAPLSVARTGSGQTISFEASLHELVKRVRLVTLTRASGADPDFPENITYTLRGIGWSGIDEQQAFTPRFLRPVRSGEARIHPAPDGSLGILMLLHDSEGAPDPGLIVLDEQVHFVACDGAQARQAPPQDAVVEMLIERLGEMVTRRVTSEGAMARRTETIEMGVLDLSKERHTDWVEVHDCEDFLVACESLDQTNAWDAAAMVTLERGVGAVVADLEDSAQQFTSAGDRILGPYLGAGAQRVRARVRAGETQGTSREVRLIVSKRI